MTETFTFVNVNLTKRNAAIRRRGAGIGAEDRVKIRSLAARNAGNRSGLDLVTARGHKSVTQKGAKKLLEITDPECPGLTDDCCSISSSSENEDSCSDKGSGSSHKKISRSAINLRETNECGDEIDALLYLMLRRFPSHLKSKTLDPFWTFCVPQFPLVSELIDHRIKYLTPAVPEIDDGASGSLESRLCLQFFKKFMDIPCFMWSQLLFAAGHMRASIQNSSRFGDVTIREQRLLENEELIIWLKGCAINTLQKTFDQKLDSVQADGRITSMLSLSAFEKCFGAPELYASHMTAIRQLIAKKGGMRGLEPVARKLLTWLSATSPELVDCYPEREVPEIQPTLGEFAAEIVDPDASPTEPTDIGELFQPIENQDIQSSTSTEASFNVYPHSPHTTVIEDRWFSFAQQLSMAAVHGSSMGDRKSPFVLEQDTQGVVFARTLVS